MEEVRISVAYGELWNADACSAYCVAHDEPSVVEMECALEDGAIPWAAVFEAARVAGLDAGRRFGMLVDEVAECVEFWQVPTPTPNDMLRAAQAVGVVV